MNEDNPSCDGPFGDARIEYPVHFDLRIIYIVSEAPALSSVLEATLKRLGIPFSIIQGVSTPGGKYGRMGARVTIDSKQKMDSLYAEVSTIPGVKTVI